MESNQALRYNKGKVPLSCIFQSREAIEGLARVLEMGGKKYGKVNWKKGSSTDSIVDSLMRHLTKLMDGEMYDDESGLLHADHLLTNAYFLSHFQHKEQQKQEKDDG